MIELCRLELARITPAKNECTSAARLSCFHVIKAPKNQCPERDIRIKLEAHGDRDGAAKINVAVKAVTVLNNSSGGNLPTTKKSMSVV